MNQQPRPALKASWYRQASRRVYVVSEGCLSREEDSPVHPAQGIGPLAVVDERPQRPQVLIEEPAIDRGESVVSLGELLHSQCWHALFPGIYHGDLQPTGVNQHGGKLRRATGDFLYAVAQTRNRRPPAGNRPLLCGRSEHTVRGRRHNRRRVTRAAADQKDAQCREG